MYFFLMLSFLLHLQKMLKEETSVNDQMHPINANVCHC